MSCDHLAKGPACRPHWRPSSCIPGAATSLQLLKLSRQKWGSPLWSRSSRKVPQWFNKDRNLPSKSWTNGVLALEYQLWVATTCVLFWTTQCLPENTPILRVQHAAISCPGLGLHTSIVEIDSRAPFHAFFMFVTPHPLFLSPPHNSSVAICCYHIYIAILVSLCNILVCRKDICMFIYI
jgi:hypothetical protein